MTTATNTTPAVQINVNDLISKLLTVANQSISLEAVCDIVAQVEKEAAAQTANVVQLFSFPTPRQYTISAPANSYKPFDAKGKKVFARDYFRSIADAVAGDEVTVEVQAGLSAAGVQKNINSLLDAAVNPKFAGFKTTRTAKGVLVKFS